ncbi:MAG: PaaI family thioesterase, partial [Poseidonia sp.]
MTLSSPPEMIGYMAELGVERTLWKPGASRLELTLTEDHLNKGGVAHGGIHMMLLDSALGSALVASLKVEEWCATAQLSTSFLAAARPGEHMVAEGRVVRRGKNVAHLAGEVKVGERLVASA